MGIFDKFKIGFKKSATALTSGLREIIIKKAESIKSSRGPTGFKNVEVELNSSWWRKNEFNIIVAPGLFTHKRLSDRGY